MERTFATLAGAAALAAALATSPGAAADPVKVFAAGSLAPAVKEMVGAAGLPPAATVFLGKNADLLLY